MTLRRTVLSRAALGGAALLVAVASSSVAAAAEGPPPGTALAGQGTVLTVVGLTRVDSAVRLVVTLANHGSDSVQLEQVTRQYSDPRGCLSFHLLDPATGKVGLPVGQTAKSCQPANLHPFLEHGEQVTFTLDIADPGGSTLDVLDVAGGVVHGVHVTGDPAPSSTDVTTLHPRSASFNARSKTAGTRVTKGKKTTIDLDTDVLFAVDSAKLSAKANATLDKAAAELKKQSGRTVEVSGHTDSTGTSAHNQTLSQRRAAAVQQALAKRLGSGWSYQVRGYGETRPLVPEADASGHVDPAARALNRRVEVAVG